MLAKRIIPCLDVRAGQVVKGVQFTDHQILGDILDYAHYYREAGADELVFYDITASAEGRVVDRQWVSQVARILDIPFSVAGGIRSLEDARQILNAGADKISLNSPALENPELLTTLAAEFGSQCVVVGIDSHEQDGEYYVKQYTGDKNTMRSTSWRTVDWAREAKNLGAGELVINCMNQDGMKSGYDLKQLKTLRALVRLPLIASGGAGKMSHFKEVFKEACVDAALAASVFHKKQILIPDLKKYLQSENIEVRL